MLKKVRIKNFLSCEDTEIEFDNVTALIGRNAAGKTNILKAIEFCAQFAVGNEPLNKYLPVGKSSFLEDIESVHNIDFLIDHKIFKYRRNVEVEFYPVEDDAPDMVITLMESLLYQTDKNEWKVIAERKDGSAKHYNNEETNIEINSEAPMIFSLLALLPQKKIHSDIKKIFNYLSEIKYYTLDNVEHIADNHSILVDDYKQWKSKNNKTKTSVLMRLLDMWNENKELLNELQELLGKNGLNLINSISIVQFNNIYILFFSVSSTQVSYSHLSYGTQRVLIILLALLYDKSTTLLIEQPEDGIHLGLLRKVLSICFEYAEVYNKQLIITTHSPDVIDMFQPENIRFVKMTEHGTKASCLDKERLPFVHEYIENEGALSDFIEAMDDE